MERNDKCFCGSGKKYKKCHYHIKDDSVIANIYKTRVNYDYKCKELNLCNNCIKDCYKCCNNNFPIPEQEFLLILDYLLNNEIVLDKYINKSKLIIEYVKKNRPQLLDQYLTKLPNTQFDMSNMLQCFDIEVIGINWPFCIFLENGRCSIYNIRPAICRMYGSTMKCYTLNNSDVVTEEGEALFDNSYYLQSDKGDIMIRPFPIYYWFGYFMGDKIKYDKMLCKLNAIRTMSLSDYIRIYPVLSM